MPDARRFDRGGRRRLPQERRLRNRPVQIGAAEHDGVMHIQLKLTFDCEPDAAWRALKSPAVLAEIYAPLLTPESTDGGFPTSWSEGTHGVMLKALNLVPVGGQDIRLTFEDDRADGVRILHDSGQPTSGTLALLDRWDHRMAVAPSPTEPGKTLYRDRLEIGGAIAPAVWYPLWSLWQWRGARMKQMAHTWAFDPPQPESPSEPQTESQPTS